MFSKSSHVKNSFSLKNGSHSSQLFTKSINQLARVSAIDHDNCFGVPHMQPYQVKSVHAPVIEHLKAAKDKYNYDVDYVMSSSNRQCIYLDCINAIHNQNNLAYPVAEALAKELGAWFDPLLLTDITANRKPGFTIKLMKDYILNKGLRFSDDDLSSKDLKDLINEGHAGYLFSEDKVNIIYAQIHRMALMHPNAKIHYDVYDDLSVEVLTALKNFYEKHHMLIPRNTKLSLNYFETGNYDESSRASLNLPTRLYEINGTGEVDPNYYETIKIMEEIAKSEEGNKGRYQIAKYLTPDLINEAWLQRKPKNSAE